MVEEKQRTGVMLLNEIFGKRSLKSRATQWLMKKTNNPYRIQDLSKGSKEDFRGPLENDAKQLQKSAGTEYDIADSKNNWMHVSAQLAADEGNQEQSDKISRLRRQFAKAIYEEHWMEAARVFREFQDIR